MNLLVKNAYYFSRKDKNETWKFIMSTFSDLAGSVGDAGMNGLCSKSYGCIPKALSQAKDNNSRTDILMHWHINLYDFSLPFQENPEGTVLRDPWKSILFNWKALPPPLIIISTRCRKVLFHSLWANTEL